jgi:group I intron endonuclease
MVIYKATNKINGKSYVGQTIRTLNERKQSHLNDSNNNSTCYFHNAIRKYGKASFKWEILDECDKSGGDSNMKRWHFDNCKDIIYGN